MYTLAIILLLVVPFIIYLVISSKKKKKDIKEHGERTNYHEGEAKDTHHTR
ncbi:hypothetical protein [Nafulsella turpanensis]|uniref:hypothetical protein n=1 Tax=Nafulsella turpanensis TaxID=1265690 RepID=UPI00037FBC84|nr:hypothetical protein [Nafulsella turpanensis]